MRGAVRGLPGKMLPRSLLGQMLLAVALALLVAQGLSAVLLYRSAEQRRETRAADQLAFLLAAETRANARSTGEAPADERRRMRWLRVERSTASPLRRGEERQSGREALLAEALVDQGVVPADLLVTDRLLRDDPYYRSDLRDSWRWRNARDLRRGRLLLAAMRLPGEDTYSIARTPLPEGDREQLWLLIAQTLVLYVVLVGGLALLLRRITRPLAALTRRVESFAETRATEGQLAPSGPGDMRRLIEAHNAMEARIAALLDEKDVMLGAIGHDLKTPLAALRVRIESVEDSAEREKMAATIEDITRSLDDILSLARVGRPSDPLERTDLAALVASVVEEYEDMGAPVELGASERLPLPLRATWLRRALRNLVGNALRYGQRARVSLRRESAPGGAWAVIRIEDDGPGIPESDIGAMLEPFARGETSRNRETGGAGLGLTLARAIADQHGGQLVLANRRDENGHVAGLVAELRLPLH